MGKKDVLIVAYGASVLLFRGPLIQALMRKGWDVVLAVPDLPEEAARTLASWRVQVEHYRLSRTGVNPITDLATLWDLNRLLFRVKPQMVLTFQHKSNVYGLLAAALAGVPIRGAMVEGLGYAFTPGDEGLRKWVVRQVLTLLYRLTLPQASKVFFLNPDDMAEFSRLGLLPKGKAVLLGGIGVPLEEWQPAPPHLNPFTFTLIARLLAEKGVREFAEAARTVKARHPQACFLLIGPLDTNPGAIPEAEVRGWVEEGILEWVPWTEDVRHYLRRTSVYVLPSYYREGVPRSTQEAMAMARPVITTDAPGCRETVEHGVNGFLVPPRDPGALAEAMEVFLREPGLVEKMGRESRRMAEERFDAHKQAERLMGVLGLK
jgi:glycosyltransferase involved in cell wall biosynthesis